MDPITLAIINLLISMALTLASTLVKQMFAQDKKNVAGVRGTMQTGGDLSPSFIIGRYGTGGKLKYAGTWGEVDGVPNAYYSKVVEVSFLPIRGYAGWFVNGERVTLAASKTGNLGYAVLEYRDDDGVDHLWINPYLGDQTTADPLMRAKFGSDPDRPYTADMVGRGLGYFVATALVNRDLFTGFPEYMAEVDGIALTDPRGDNKHDNPIVAIYTLMRGLYYGGQWVYGPQNITDYNFRYSNLESEADKCDAARSLSGGGTEPRFRAGLEISIDSEPHAIIGEFLKACAGRWAEVGGVYKFLVGEPGSPVVSFTDEDIIVTEQQTFDPFPGLESLFNGITATYPEPAEAWQMKEAPPRYSPSLEADDDNRRLPFSTEYKAAPFAVQVQELMRAAIEETRRFRVLTHTMPPEWWEYEVLDVAQWTSVRNGFDSKQFLITAMEDLPSSNQRVAVQEIDPADYSWSSGYQLPYSVTPLTIGRPPEQPMTGWNVAPYEFPDSGNQARRFGVEVFYASGLVDVQAVRIQVREDFGDNNIVFDGEVPYDPAVLSPSKPITWAGIIPDEDYEVRGKYVPFSGRKTAWSAWLGVTTPDIRLGPYDVSGIDLGALGEDVSGYLEWIGPNVRDILQEAEELAAATADEVLSNYSQHQTIRRELSLSIANVTAAFQEAITVAVGPTSSLVQQLVTLDAIYGEGLAGVTTLARAAVEGTTANAALISLLEAEIDGVAASITIAAEVEASPGGGWARYGVSVTAEDNVAFFYMDVNGPLRRIVFGTDQFVLTDGVNNDSPFVWAGGVLTVKTLVASEITVVDKFNGYDINADGTIETPQVAEHSFSEITVLLQTAPVTPSGSGAEVLSGTVPVDADALATGVVLNFTAFMDRPDIDIDNVGYWRIALDKNGSLFDVSPSLFYDDNFSYQPVAVFVDEAPGTDPFYRIRAVPVSGPTDFEISGGVLTVSYFKR
jgi:hypothetical protein